MSKLLLGSNGGGVDLTKNLIAHYLLNNNAADSHGDYDGVASNVDFQSDDSYFTTILNSYITTPLVDIASETNTYTISGWFTASENTGPYRTIIIGTEGTNSIKMGVALGINSDGIVRVSRANDTTQNLATSSTVYDLDNSKHFFVITYDGTTLKCAIDETDTFSIASTLSANNGITQFGRYGSSADTLEYYSGKISNVRFYNEVKTQTFINALFEEGYYPKPLPLPTTDGLMAHYPLTGTAEDTTGNRNGTEVGVTYVDNAEFGSIARFNNNNGTTSVPTSQIKIPQAYIDNFTISFWASVDIPSNSNIIISKDNDTAHYEFIRLRGDNTLDMAIDNTFSSTIQSDHGTSEKLFVITRNGGSFILYVNGISKGSGTCSSATINLGLFGSLFDTSSSSANFKGTLRNVRLYHSILSQQEITDIYNYEKNFRAIDIDDGLVAFYPLANNSKDNYYNEFDSIHDADVTYNGNSANFNGTNGYIIIPDNTMTIGQPFCITCWIKEDNFNSVENSIIEIVSGTYPEDTVILMAGQADTSDKKRRLYIRNHIENAVALEQGSPTHITNTWRFMAFQWDGTHISGYEDNEFIGELPFTFSNSYTSLADKIHIGTSANASRFLDGNLAKLRIYNKALSGEQIDVIYNTEKGDFE